MSNKMRYIKTGGKSPYNYSVSLLHAANVAGMFSLETPDKAPLC